MKVKKNKPSEEQLKWHEHLVAQGHAVIVCYSWNEASDYIIQYLEGEKL